MDLGAIGQWSSEFSLDLHLARPASQFRRRNLPSSRAVIDPACRSDVLAAWPGKGEAMGMWGSL